MIDNGLGSLGKGLHLAHLNVRSLLGGHSFDVLKHQIENSGLGVFSLSETWLTESTPDKSISMKDYNSVRLDRAWGDPTQGLKRGGGLACYIKEGINYSDTKYSHLNKACPDVEMLWLSISLANVRPLVIVSIYRPPQGRYKCCCELVNEMFERANLKDNTDVFLIGDFNIDFSDRKTSEFRELDFTTQSLGLKQLITTPTRYSFRNGVAKNSKIDLIFSNSDFIAHTSTLDLNIGDHLAVLVTCKKTAVKHEKVEFRGRSYRNYVREEFQNKLVNENWEPYYECNDSDVLWDIMQTKILDENNTMCPMKSFKVNERREVWITNEALEAIKDKDNAMKRAKRTGFQEDWDIARRERNRVGREIENLRVNYLKQQQTDHKDDPKKFWKSVSTVIPNQKSNSGTIWLKETVQSADIPSNQAATYINKFFTEVGSSLARNHRSAWRYFGETIQDSIEGITTDVDEVNKLCRDINTMKSSGIDEISSRVCKDAFLVLGQQLVHLFNTSLSTCHFLEAWKRAKVIPLFKGGNREDVSNYRPVSLLPLPGKLLEKIVHTRITSFWDFNNFLSGDQGGFRKGFSTTATIADITDDFFEQINRGNTTVAAFVDLRKAFDTVNPRILLKKLERAGIREDLLDWCTSYLTDRFQCTLANGVTSPLLPVVCGVPQGSVLGPLFFLVHVNDVQQALDHCGLKLYTDDTVLYQSSVNCTLATNSLQTSLNLFANWCLINQLTININKTKIVVFGSRYKVKKAKNISVKLDNMNLKQVPSYKYLGLILDSTLNYNHHIASVIRTVLHKMTLLARMKKYLNDETAVSIYRSMLLPYFDYADVIYSKANSKDLDRLQKLQNKCLRISLGRDRRFNTKETHKLAGVPLLKERRLAHVRNFMY